MSAADISWPKFRKQSSYENWRIHLLYLDQIGDVRVPLTLESTAAPSSFPTSPCTAHLKASFTWTTSSLSRHMFFSLTRTTQQSILTFSIFSMQRPLIRDLITLCFWALVRGSHITVGSGVWTLTGWVRRDRHYNVQRSSCESYESNLYQNV